METRKATPALKSRAGRDEAELRFELVAAGVLGLALSAGAAAITAAGAAGEDAALAAAARASMVAVPVAVGLYAWHRGHAERFGQLLVLLGMGWSLTTLAESGDELLHSIGTVAGWLGEVGLAWLVLAFPAGELRRRVDQALVWAAVAIVATLYLPTVLLATAYPAPSPWSGCASDCPGNAFFLGDAEPAVVHSILLPVREALTVLLILAVTARLAQRVGVASRLMRQTLAPVLFVASARLVVEAIGFALRRADADSPVVGVLMWPIALGVPAVAAAFFVGLIRRRLYAADALERLAIRVKGHLSRDELRVALSEAADDPSLQLVYSVNGCADHWVDASGRPVRRRGPNRGDASGR
jgi:hypothetical protein